MEEEDPITIITAVSLALTAGTTAYEMANKPSAPKPVAPTAQQTAAQNAQLQRQEKAAITQQLPNVLSQTSGLANPEYAGLMASLMAGTAGQPGNTGALNSAVAQAFGLSQAPATPKSFTPAGSSPNTAAGAFPTGPVNLSEFVNSYITG